MKAESESARFAEAAERLQRDLAQALNDDLNAPRAVAAVFAFMNEGHAALDAGERPGPSSIAAWNQAEGVLGITSDVLVITVRGGTEEPAAETHLAEDPPTDSAAAESWARQWATRRAQYKSSRNYAEADRIRALLGEHGFQVRDSKDGSIDVVRTGKRSV
jgi:cysteinyl-tRNA synthetase